MMGSSTMAAMVPELLKYPRTPHVESSRLQPGDADLDQVPFAALAGRQLVVEEKLDGANAGISFGTSGELLIQSRGHYLVGGPRERHFAQLKAWANAHRAALWDALGDTYVLYGEWLGAKHTVFYDTLPHLFFEFDLYDRSQGVFLDTDSRKAVLAGSPVLSAPVLHVGQVSSLAELGGLIRRSLYKSERWRERLVELARMAGQDPERVLAETDGSDLAEGLYIKEEAAGVVVARYKLVRADFLNAIVDPKGAPSSHWLDRPHLSNLCAEGSDLYAPALVPTMARLRPGQVA